MHGSSIRHHQITFLLPWILTSLQCFYILDTLLLGGSQEGVSPHGDWRSPHVERHCILDTLSLGAGGPHVPNGLHPVQEALGDDFPMWIVYVSQNLTFGGGLLGITYGIMSTSWDPSREGTVCGESGRGRAIPS